MNAHTFELARKLGDHLLSHGHTVTTAESCTGGGVGYAITSTAGSSQWFHGGFIVYSNDMKSSLLAVAPDIIARHGAVSEPVVRAMLAGAIARSGAQLGVSISGIAGPGGAGPGKPVGTVCFAVGSSDRCDALTCCFEGDRHQVREQAVTKALALLLEFRL